MDELSNYLNFITDYNQSFESNLTKEFIIDEIDKNKINSEDELLDIIFNIENGNQKHNAELLELKGFKYPVINFIQNHMYFGLSLFINDNLNNKCDRKIFFRKLGISTVDFFNFEQRIKDLERIYKTYSDVSYNFFDILVKYSGIPKKSFLIKNVPNPHGDIFYEYLLFEYEDKYILLGFYVFD